MLPLEVNSESQRNLDMNGPSLQKVRRLGHEVVTPQIETARGRTWEHDSRS